ncbi:MAG: hypothetical protein K2X27_11175 [Candidatus Obscuribacterales bacterium]|nr:hypothetical protein [Candidatus Obscuribacterales bacterium]
MKDIIKATSTIEKGFLCGRSQDLPFENLDDFYARGQIVHKERFNVYQPEGLLTDILIPTKEADYERASLSDAISAIKSCFDPDYINQLILLDHLHPMTPWLLQTENSHVLSESSIEGQVLLYQPTAQDIRQSILYEWCGLLRMYSPQSEELFGLARELEPLHIAQTTQRTENVKLAWNRFALMMLRGTDDESFRLCAEYPIRSAVFGRFLHIAMAGIMDFRRQENYQASLERAFFIDYSATTLALTVLESSAFPKEYADPLIQFLKCVHPQEQS